MDRAELASRRAAGSMLVTLGSQTLRAVRGADRRAQRDASCAGAICDGVIEATER